MTMVVPRIIPCGAAVLAFSTAPLAGQDVPGATGRIEGVVTVGSALEARRLNLRLYPEVGASPVPAATEGELSERQHVVIYLDSLPWQGAPGPAAVMRQQNEAFVPHILPVVRGASVTFPNDDPVFHNVFSLSRARSFDLGQYPRGQAKTVTFSREGVVPVFCHIHADMSAVVLVLGNPHYVMPDAEGRYVMADVPVGDRVLVAWHERTQPVIRRVRVERGQVTRLDWTVPLSSERQPRE